MQFHVKKKKKNPSTMTFKMGMIMEYSMNIFLSATPKEGCDEI